MALYASDSEVREVALADLTWLCEAIRSAPFHSGDSAQSRTKLISSRRPPLTPYAAGQLIQRYEKYLEIGACLRAIRDITQLTRSKSKLRDRGKSDDQLQVTAAKRLGIPAQWLAECWKPSTKLHEWALATVAKDLEATPDAVRGRITEAKRLLADDGVLFHRTSEAERRLRADRIMRARDRKKKGGDGFFRRY